MEDIKQAIKDIKKLKNDLKGIKKDIKIEETVDTEDFKHLEKAFKDLKKQLKDLKDEWLQELQKDNHYNTLREMKLSKVEEIAAAQQKLAILINQEPLKAIDISTDTDDGPVRIQIMPEMRVYLNGREEKRN